MRIAPEAVSGVAHAERLEQRDDRPTPLRPLHAGREGLIDVLPDGAQRIECGSRVLGDISDLLVQHRPHPGLVELVKVDSVEADAAGLDLADRWSEQAHDAQGNSAL